MSILAFYRRIFTLNIMWFRYLVYVMAVYTTGWLIACFFSALFQWYITPSSVNDITVLIGCSFPPSFFYERFNPTLNPPPEGFCGANNAPLVIAGSALNSVGDLIIFALPIGMLWRLQLKRSHKIALILVFATGAL